jgi:hypothetical protein
MTQLPGCPKVTVEPEMVQAEPVEDGSMLNVTGFPEPPPVAAASSQETNLHNSGISRITHSRNTIAPPRADWALEHIRHQ